MTPGRTDDAYSPAAATLDQVECPLAILGALDETFAEGAAGAHLRSVGETSRGMAQSGFHDNQLGHVQLPLDPQGVQGGQSGAKPKRHPATDVTVDEERGFKDRVPQRAERLALLVPGSGWRRSAPFS